MSKRMSEKEAMKAAEALLKKYDEISRECFEREQDKVITFKIK